LERGWASLRLDGQTRNRHELVEKFQKSDGPPVFLISLKAGGYGLNLTAADTVIHFDPWWNPAAEAQATDRAHRIGQTRPVTVYRLLTRGTVEEKVLRMQMRKSALAAAIDEHGTGDAPDLGIDELRKLLIME
jgi:SNF2 family DNA or RNA helicase